MSDLDLINRIEDVRRDNNKNWMAILRIAMAANPAETKKLLVAILEKDRAISKLMEELVLVA